MGLDQLAFNDFPYTVVFTVTVTVCLLAFVLQRRLQRPEKTVSASVIIDRITIEELQEKLHRQERIIEHLQRELTTMRDKGPGSDKAGWSEIDLDVQSAKLVLGLDPFKEHETSMVKQAFRQRARQVHPDVGGSEAWFKLTQSAQDVLLGKR